MIRDMGTHHHEDLVHARFLQTLAAPRWAVLYRFHDGKIAEVWTPPTTCA